MAGTYGKQAQKMIDLQNPDGSWGFFHTLSKKSRLSTEQALRRLWILGLTKEDAPVKKCLDYMKLCLDHIVILPDRREKVMNWDFFESHMIAAWIKIFEPENIRALEIADFWAEIVTNTFQGGFFDEKRYADIYRHHIPVLNRGERLIGLSQFYMVMLLQGKLDTQTESAFFDYILHNDTGIYYVYGKQIASVPEPFASIEASRYIGALECLAGYGCAGEKLSFTIDWLHMNQNGRNQWDMGSTVNDNIYFPRSDSWRNSDDRITDCTQRIEALIHKLTSVK